MPFGPKRARRAAQSSPKRLQVDPKRALGKFPRGSQESQPTSDRMVPSRLQGAPLRAPGACLGALWGPAYNCQVLGPHLTVSMGPSGSAMRPICDPSGSLWHPQAAAGAVVGAGAGVGLPRGGLAGPTGRPSLCSPPGPGSAWGAPFGCTWIRRDIPKGLVTFTHPPNRTPKLAK